MEKVGNPPEEKRKGASWDRGWCKHKKRPTEPRKGNRMVAGTKGVGKKRAEIYKGGSNPVHRKKKRKKQKGKTKRIINGAEPKEKGNALRRDVKRREGSHDNVAPTCRQTAHQSGG